MRKNAQPWGGQKTLRFLGSRTASWRLLRGLIALTALLAATACTTIFPSTVANRPDGEGYAGVGELIVQIRVMEDKGSWFDPFMPHKSTRATVELRYLGINPAGRAVFERRDVDKLAGTPVTPSRAGGLESGDGVAEAKMPSDTHDILLDLRMARQIRIQGKIIEIVEASDSGVVFRLY